MLRMIFLFSFGLKRPIRCEPYLTIVYLWNIKVVTREIVLLQHIVRKGLRRQAMSDAI